jgi:hypothetical protein
MFYNTRTQQLLNTCPLNGYLSDGTLVQGLNITDAATQKACGILPVLSDTPSQPEGYLEDLSQRVISVEENRVNIIRTWVIIQPVVPSTISARQIRLWLIDNNITLSSVDSAIATISDPVLREKTQVEWEFAPYVERNHPMINTLGSILGLNSTQIDQAFIEASVL